jgi:predicted RNase H-like nuclease (RuvC/YqgF family)
LKAKNDAEDESTRIAFSNLRSRVNELRHNVEEKEEMLNTLASDWIGDHYEFQKTYQEKDYKISKLETDNAQSAKRIANLKAQIEA